MDMKKKLLDMKKQGQDILTTLQNLLAPSVDSSDNVLERDVIGNKGDSISIRDPESYMSIQLNSQMSLIKGLMQMLNRIEKREMPSITLLETWQEFVNGGYIQSNDNFEVTNPSGGGGVPGDWTRAYDSEPYIIVHNQAQGGDSRIVSVQQYPLCTNSNGLVLDKNPKKFIWKKTVLEFMYSFYSAQVNDLYTLGSLMGFTREKADINTSQNLIAFVPKPIGFDCIVRLNGSQQLVFVPYVFDLFPARMRIETLYSTLSPTKSFVKFYINETLVATFTADIPDNTPFINFFFKENVFESTNALYLIRFWTEGEGDSRYI